MEQTNINITVDATGIPAKRPTFITVLCILSFVGIAFSLIGGLMNYFTYSGLAATNEAFGGSMSTGTAADQQLNETMNAMSSMLGLDYGKMAMAELIKALLNIPILVGVLLMWKQKKTGYYIYAPFELIQPLVPLFLGMGLFGGIMAIVGLIFSILFIILYGVNLKHMR